MGGKHAKIETGLDFVNPWDYCVRQLAGTARIQLNPIINIHGSAIDTNP
jgi:hypothetical protein